MKKLNELFEGQSSDIKIYSIHSDSRYVKPFSIFFCIEGLTVDGHKYVDDAIFQGAKVIVHSKDFSYYNPNIIYIRSDDTVGELNRVAACFYDYPSQKLKVIGITGTNGKTVVAQNIKNIMANYTGSGYIGTMDTTYANIEDLSRFTTPETIYLQQHLANMVFNDVKIATLEVSSHGLALRRVENIDFDICVLTNIYSEHLDFHGTMEKYVASKRLLFERLKSSGVAVINRDDIYFDAFKNHTKARIISFGINHDDADVLAKNIRLHMDHTSFDLVLKGNIYGIKVPLLAKFNVYNVLAIIGVLLALGFDNEMIIENIKRLQVTKGRMESLPNNYGFKVLIDSCQYESSYQNVFDFAKSIKKEKGRIIALLGAPSKRNYKLRSFLGKLAEKYCDHVVLTELDKRGEDPQLICEDIQKELKTVSSVIITNRQIAIEQVIELACRDDIILILGKGHETFISLESGTTNYPGDKEIAKMALEAIYGSGISDDEVNDLHRVL